VKVHFSHWVQSGVEVYSFFDVAFPAEA